MTEEIQSLIDQLVVKADQIRQENYDQGLAFARDLTTSSGLKQVNGQIRDLRSASRKREKLQRELDRYDEAVKEAVANLA